MQSHKTGPWSQEDDTLLRDLLPHHTYKELAEKFGRTFYSVKSRAIKHLRINKDGKWRSLESYFLMYANKAGACWEWTGPRDKHGYGVFRRDGKLWFAHRLSMYLQNGHIERGKLVLHTCDNKGCVNPSHLYVGTYSENTRDTLERLWKRVNPDIARTIRFMCSTGLRDSQVAAILGFSCSTITRVRKRETWGFVKDWSSVCDGLTLTRAVEGFSWARTAGGTHPAHTQSIAPNPGNAHGGRHSE